MRIVLAIVLLALALVLAGCGPKGDPLLGKWTPVEVYQKGVTTALTNGSDAAIDVTKENTADGIFYILTRADGQVFRGYVHEGDENVVTFVISEEKDGVEARMQIDPFTKRLAIRFGPLKKLPGAVGVLNAVNDQLLEYTHVK